MKNFFVGLTFFALTTQGCITTLAGTHVVDSLATIFQKTDDLENFTYACLDYFLHQPTESQLTIFEHYEKKTWRSLTTNDERLAYVILLSNKGYYLSRFGNIYESIDAYEKSWTIFRDHTLTGFDIIEYCLKPLGNNYSMLGDYTSAGNIIKNYLFIAEKEKNFPHIIAAVINLSIIYHDTGYYTEAIKILSDVLPLKEMPLQKKGLVYTNLARNYENIHNLSKAKHYALLALRSFKLHSDADTPVHLVNVYKILSLISMRLNEPEHSLRFFEKARALAALHTHAFKSRELAKLSLEYAGLLTLRKQYKEAFKAYQQALTTLLPTYKPGNDDALPDASLFYAENAIKEAFDGLADLYVQLNNSEKAIACYELSFVVEDILRATYNYQSAKLQQQVENRSRAERTIALLFQLGNQTGNSQYIIRAFQIAERTKAIILKETIEDRYVRQSIKQDTLLQQESNLRFKQATVASALALEQGKLHSANIDYINQLLARQVQIAIEIKSIQKAIQLNYGPSTRSDGLDVDALQKKLSHDNAVLIAYVMGDLALFVFTVDANTISLQRVENNKGLKESILQFNTLFHGSSNINENIESYKSISVALYQQLHLPEKSTHKNLILVPDGLLHTIPFDALLYEKAVGTTYSDFPYLIKKHTISYQPSALLYTHFPIPPQRNTQSMLALFPVFENSSRMLEYSLMESESIRSHFKKGTYLLKEEATKKLFLDYAPDYSIIHLSTHASAGDATEPPSIHFRDSILYLPQVYGLQLQPDLMVLSACETGVGKLAKGEGVLSLAHGFQLAGVRNIILSLWKVNDRSTATLFSDFYANYLKTGMKADALRQAKLDYLLNDGISNAHKSPFYWAAFVYYGNNEEKVVPHSSTFSRLLIALAIIIIAFLILVIVKRNRQTTP